MNDVSAAELAADRESVADSAYECRVAPVGAGLLSADFEVRSPDGATRRPGTVSAPSLLSATVRTTTDGVQELEVCVEDLGDQPARLEWAWPIGSVAAVWRPDSGAKRNLYAGWDARSSRTVRSAPVAALIGADDLNHLTVSLSSDVRACDLAIALDTKAAQWLVQAVITDVEPSDGVLRFVMRVDGRNQHFADALRGVTDAWSAELGERSLPVPQLAHEATYCTWYNSHQDISAASVERDARASADFGCRSVIVDDGWQTNDTAGGYAYCGDWEPYPETFPDMAAHVQRVHEAGMRYVLWIAPALIGAHSKAWGRFQDRTLGRLEELSADLLDPRFPEVRDHLVESCLRPVRDWGVDGLKIDFVDVWDRLDRPWEPGMDCRTVDEGVERMLEAIAKGLPQSQPFIEFRQEYVSPRLWQFGTILRAADCPLDSVDNRIRTIDARLLAGDRAVHADPIMWHREATAKEVADQFIGILFATPQVSVDLAGLSETHQQVARFWLGFMKSNAPTLLHGDLKPSRADARYTKVIARTPSTTIAVAYADSLVRLGEGLTPEITLVNGGPVPGIVLDASDLGPVSLAITDCRGVTLSTSLTTPPTGLWEIPVPAGGVAQIERVISP